MSHMVFTNCTASASLVHISNCKSSNEDIAMMDSEFNSHANGPAITIESGCHLKIKRGLFSNHSSNLSVIRVLDGARVTIIDSQFNGSNVASTIVVQDAFLKTQQCNFTENNGVNGGAIFLDVSDAL